jgi:hypothetical protein
MNNLSTSFKSPAAAGGYVPFSLKIFFAAIFTLLILSPEAQAQTANKRLYLKSGEILNRTVPTAATAQNTVALVKSPATFINSTSAVSANNGTNGPLTFTNYTVAAGTDRILIVSIAHGTEQTITGVSFGAQQLTRLDTQRNGAVVQAELWYLLLGNSASDTTANVTVSFTGSLRYAMGVSNFTNVDQTTPFGTIAKLNFAATTNVSLNVASGEGDVIIDAVGVDANGGNQANFQPGINQTVIFRESTSKFRGGSSRKLAVVGDSTSMSWSNANAQPWAVLAVPLKGVASEVDFIQSPAMCSPFTINAGQTITAFSNATVTSGTASGANIPLVFRLYQGSNLIFQSTSAANSGLAGINTNGTLTWTGTIASDFTVAAGQSLRAEFSSEYAAASIRLDYDASSSISYVQLPTSTFINVDSLNVYDAPYPGGVIISEKAVGVTNYVRAVVSDPFGFNDITGLNANITGPAGFSGAGTSVATYGCKRVYQYAFTPTIDGTYNVLVTALEGTEGTVTDTSNINFNVVKPTVEVTKTKTNPANPPYTLNDVITYSIKLKNVGLSNLTFLPLQDLFDTGCFQFLTASVTPSATSPGGDMEQPRSVGSRRQYCS